MLKQPSHSDAIHPQTSPRPLLPKEHEGLGKCLLLGKNKKASPILIFVTHPSTSYFHHRRRPQSNWMGQNKTCAIGPTSVHKTREVGGRKGVEDCG